MSSTVRADFDELYADVIIWCWPILWLNIGLMLIWIRARKAEGRTHFAYQVTRRGGIQILWVTDAAPTYPPAELAACYATDWAAEARYAPRIAWAAPLNGVAALCRIARSGLRLPAPAPAPILQAPLPARPP